MAFGPFIATNDALLKTLNDDRESRLNHAPRQLFLSNETLIPQVPDLILGKSETYCLHLPRGNSSSLEQCDGGSMKSMSMTSRNCDHNARL